MRIALLLTGSLLSLGLFQMAESAQSTAERVVKTSIKPNWIRDGKGLWYKNELHAGQAEYVVVDCASGVRQPAFDHQRLAAALTEAGIPATAGALPLRNVGFEQQAHHLTFRAGGKDWQFDVSSHELSPNDHPAKPQRESSLQRFRPRGASGAEEMLVTFMNQTGEAVELLWSAAADQETSYGTLAAGERRQQHTYAGHIWHVLGQDGRSLGYFQATADQTEVAIQDQPDSTPEDVREPENVRRGSRRRRSSSDRATSPDNRWIAEVREHNIVLIDAATQDVQQLSSDGSPQDYYSRLSFSPDSQSLAAFRIRQVQAKPVFRVNSALPDDEFRAGFVEQGYALPGDEFSEYEPRVFDVARRSAVPTQVDVIDFGVPQIHWHGEHLFTYEQVDRGHQRFRLVEIDGLTGASRNIIDERAETFIWTAHRDAMNIPKITWLSDNKEIIFVSEMDGYRHLFLIDVASGAIRHTITPGEYVVSAIEEIDEQQRQIWFQAAGYYADQDPYFTHYFRINLDGSDLVPLTTGNGTHALQFSPDREYALDTYSRVDLPPIHELRRMSDGKNMCELERADATHSSWRPPTVFVAKGRDGETDIWGIIEFPENFDASQAYPIIEDIYAGPHGFFTPKRFSPRPRYKQLTELGFVVVKLDGMGTAGRSKKFHDVCWHNLKDAGFPDRVAWIRAAAQAYPCMDATRVGIYGTSAGGQSAAGALLFHGEFYRAAFAACGCHDNRMDKASWNEQWMGFPVGPQYAASSNIEHASQLSGQLMLMVGEMDSNVPPASTFKFANALIQSDKDFELLVMPGLGHSDGGRYGNRKRNAFFQKHLLGQ